jgi:hypothetical protein
MINPVHGDKPVAPSSERSDPSAKSRGQEERAARPVPGQAATASPTDTTLEVDKAWQLYQLENQGPRLESPGIASPEEARSLLARILDQISSAPRQALSSQGAMAGAALAHLLENAPT